MILVDTNIIIDFWDKPTDIARKVFEENDIATCGVIKNRTSAWQQFGKPI